MANGRLRTLLALTSVLACGSAAAQPAADFYKGKQIDMFIGTPAGGGYDQYGRLLGRHMSRYIPGHPTFVYRNMPSGGGRQAMHTSPFRTVDDIRNAEMVMGSSGLTASDTIHAKLINRIAGTKIRLIHGYNGSNGVHVAMERGEVQGRCGLGWDSIVSRYPHWLKDNQIAVLAQFGLSRHPDLPKVTSIVDLARTTEDRQLVELLLAQLQMGRPFFAPPGVPADRVHILRRALDATTKDEAFLADVEKQKVELFHMKGEDVEALVRRIYATPADVVEIGKQLSTGK
jgi:tripartite-type tricarboxylate transporter receptor subunit TctC